MYHTKKHISAPTGATSWPRPSVIQDGYFTSPYLAIDSDQVMHLTYRRHGNDDRGVYYQQSKDGGETWTYPSRISAPVGTMVPMGPSHFHTYVLPEQNGMLQAVWTDEFSDSPGLYYSRSLDEGVTWETPTKVGTGAWITIARDRDGVLHMLWHTTMEASCERHELDDGATWRDRGRVLRPLEGCLGWMHLPVDSSQDLYMVSIGRVPPTGEIGMWESWWQGDWGTVLRIIPSVSVTDGPDWFDHGPDQSRLAVSLGNRLNLAWFTNDGRIWYSSTETNAPRVPPITLPAALPEPQAAALSPGEEKPLEVTPEPLPAARSEQLPVDIAPASSTSPVSTLILGVLPAMVLVLAVAFLNLRARR
jgi:hypothetical protein